jgi:hypothetical protein
MSSPVPPGTTAAPHTHWPRVFAIGFGLVLVVGVIMLAFLWPSVTATVKDLPVAVVGESAQVDQLESALDERSPHTFSFIAADDRDDAVDAIETREAYGAIILGSAPEVLTATAANPTVAQLLGSLQPALQGQVDAALAAEGIHPPSPVVVKTTDIVPLADSDPRGSILAASSFPLVLGGMIGGIAITMLVVRVWRRVATLLVYAVVGGLAIAGVLQGWFGGLQGDYLLNASAVSLTLLAIGGVIVGTVALVGRSGVAVGPVLFLLVANPISAAALPIEFLATPWGTIGQGFPPGAAATLLRDLSYFPRADTSSQWTVLIVWAVVGLLLSLLGHFRNRGAATAAARREATSIPV